MHIATLVIYSSVLAFSTSFKGIVEKLVIPTDEYKQLKKIYDNMKKKQMLELLEKPQLPMLEKLIYIRKFNKDFPEKPLFINDDEINPVPVNITKGGLLNDWDFDIYTDIF